MRVIRIADGRHPVWDGTGAALLGGRWNSAGRPVIYASVSYACCMLEILAHANTGRIPHTHRFVSAEIPDDVKVTRIPLAALPADWDADESSSAREIGDQWLCDRETAVLMVPSVVARIEWNVLVNPMHPDSSRICVSEPAPVVWDRRLFNPKARR